jgi:hypothetical protein
MSPLSATFGFIFPIQPSINIVYEATYQETKLTHYNFPYYHYTSSAMLPISIR